MEKRPIEYYDSKGNKRKGYLLDFSIKSTLAPMRNLAFNDPIAIIETEDKGIDAISLSGITFLD